MNDRSIEPKRLQRIKSTRKNTGKYLSMQYPNNKFKNTNEYEKSYLIINSYKLDNFNDYNNTEKADIIMGFVKYFAHKYILSQKYGDDIWEDVCLKNSYQIKDDSMLVCISAKYQNNIHADKFYNSFIIKKINKEYKIYIPPYI